MKSFFLLALCLCVVGTHDTLHAQNRHAPDKPITSSFPYKKQYDSTALRTMYNTAVERILRQATTDTNAFARLTYMCDTFGARFSGTPGLEQAIDWVVSEMNTDKSRKHLDTAYTDPVMVPYWKRGTAECVMTSPRVLNIAVMALGGSVGTPAGGITAEVLVVNSFEELKRRSAEAQGKIVLYNVPFTDYRRTVVYRSRGAIEAAKVGAVASLIRSVASFSINSPHTGGMAYDTTAPKIPHAAIAAETAEILGRIASRGTKITVKLTMSCESMPDRASRNVIAELRGSEKPNEVIVLGGHIDSWDVGHGAMDDGGGCFVTYEAVRLLGQLGLRPRRTLRVALWTNEENGLRGGNAYADKYGATTKHIFAFESDGGVFNPKGFAFSGSPELYAQYTAIARLLAPIGATQMGIGGGGADISPLIKHDVPQMNIEVDGSKYFWYHHTDGDTIDKLSRDEFNRCVAAIAVMMYIAADLP